MEVDILELSDRSAKFVLSKVSTSFANGIRRAMSIAITKKAIDIRDFRKLKYTKAISFC